MPHVLLVDDDRKLLSLERGFRFEGFDVRTAIRGSDGLEIARAEPQDVVVHDIGMPDLNGLPPPLSAGSEAQRVHRPGRG
jgi:DNA-binding response OmpR family regulator